MENDGVRVVNKDVFCEEHINGRILIMGDLKGKEGRNVIGKTDVIG